MMLKRSPIIREHNEARALVHDRVTACQSDVALIISRERDKKLLELQMALEPKRDFGESLERATAKVRHAEKELEEDLTKLAEANARFNAIKKRMAKLNEEKVHSFA